MRKFIFRRALATCLCTVLIATATSAPAAGGHKPVSAAANAPRNQATCAPGAIICGNIGPDIGPYVVGAAVGIAAVVVVTTVLVIHYKAAKVKGCLASGPNGLELTSSGDKAAYDLAGDTSSLKPGEQVKLKGKKKRAKGSAHQTFTVTELSKDYGACPANQNP